MVCEEWKESISAHVDGELPPDEEKKLRRHLESCPACRNYCSRMRELNVMLREDYERLEVPAERMWGNIEARLEAERLGASWFERGFGWLEEMSLAWRALATSAVALFLVTVYIQGYGGDWFAGSGPVSEKGTPVGAGAGVVTEEFDSSAYDLLESVVDESAMDTDWALLEEEVRDDAAGADTRREAESPFEGRRSGDEPQGE